MQQVVASLLYEGLFRLNTSLEPEAWLCTGYTCDDTASRYEFTLRSGVTFSDGTPLTAADVKATLGPAPEIRSATASGWRASPPSPPPGTGWSSSL